MKVSPVIPRVIQCQAGVLRMEMRKRRVLWGSSNNRQPPLEKNQVLKP